MDIMIVVPWVLLLFVVLVMVWMALGNKVSPDQLKALLNAIYQSKPVQEWKDEHWNEVEDRVRASVEDCLVEQKTYKIWTKWFNDEPSEDDEDDEDDEEDEKPKKSKDKKGKKPKKEAEPDGEKDKSEDEDSKKEEPAKPTPSDKPSKDKVKEKAKEEPVKTEKKEDLKKVEDDDVESVLKEMEGEKKKKDDD